MILSRIRIPSSVSRATPFDRGYRIDCLFPEEVEDAFGLDVARIVEVSPRDTVCSEAVLTNHEGVHG